jgi:hypothetical protein
MADVTPEPTMRIAMGLMAANPLFVASAIGIFKQLPEGLATAHKFAQSRVLRRSIGPSASISAGGG